MKQRKGRQRSWVNVFGMGIGLALAAGSLVNAKDTAPAEQILLQTSFEEGTDAPKAWTSQGGAQWSRFARTGKRSIEIRNWLPDAELDKNWDEYQRRAKSANQTEKGTADQLIRADTHKTWWVSDPIRMTGQPVKVSFWGANNITYMNDESFRAEVALVKCADDGALPDLGGNAAFESQAPLHFYREQRENYQHYARAVPEGLVWEYREAILSAGKGTYRVILHFLKEPDGQVWVDDLVVSESEGYRTSGTEAEGVRKTEWPWRLQINFPVSHNLFKQGTPLCMDLVLTTTNGVPEIRKGMTFSYEIRDFNYRWIRTDRVELKAERYPVWKMPAYLETALKNKTYLVNLAAEAASLSEHTIMVPLQLPQELDKQEGKVLFIRGEIADGNKKLAADEVSFGIFAPVMPKQENLWRGGKVGDKWSSAGDFPVALENPAYAETEPLYSDSGANGLYYRLGCQWLGGSFKKKWPEAMKTKEGPVDLGPEPTHACPDYGIFFNDYINMSYRKYNGFVPDWAANRSASATNTYGYWVFDVDGVSRYYIAGVERLKKVYPHGVVISPTAGEQPYDLWRFTEQKAVYKAIKKAHPDVQVGAWYWANDLSVAEKYDGCFDFVDTENYLDPRMDGQGAANLRKGASKKLGRDIWSSILEGCARVGSEEQSEAARGVFDFHLFNWMRGEKLLGQFEFGGAYCRTDGAPLLRDAIRAQWGETGHMGGARRMKITRWDMQGGSNIYDNVKLAYRLGAYPTYFPEQFQPALPTLTLAATIRFLDSAVFERALHLEDVFAFQFERLGKTVLFLESKGTDDIQVEVSGMKAPCETLDIYGYRYRLAPKDAKMILTAPHYPIILLFDKLLSTNDLAVRQVEDVKIRMTRPIVKKNAGEVTVNLGAGRSGELTLELDPKLEAPKGVKAGEGKDATIKVTPLEERPTGRYRTYVRIVSDGKDAGLLSLPLKMESADLKTRLVGVPMTGKQDPAVRVEAENFTSAALKLKFRFQDNYTLGGDRPQAVEKELTVPPNEKGHADFPLDRNRLRINEDYPATVVMTRPDGSQRELKDDVFFRGVPKRKAPIMLDGDLRDWPLNQLIPIEPQTRMMIGGRTGEYSRKFFSTWALDTRPDGKFKAYWMWDDQGLYVAFVVNNPKPDRPILDPALHYEQDCMFFTLYPDAYQPGEGTVMRPFKIHLSMDKAGKPTMVDGNGKVRQPDELGVVYAARQTDTGYVYEFFMKRPYIYKLRLEPGAQFSAAFVSYATKFGTPMGRNTPLYGFGRGVFTFDSGLDKMGRFVLTGE